MEVILKAFGFDHFWIKWIMSLVTSPSFSILANRAPAKPFIPSRAIYQADPMSPFLFLIMMESLSRAIKATIRESDMRGLHLHKGFQTITHQQFVNDTMLYNIPAMKEAKTFKVILETFKEALVMEINSSKPMIFFFNVNIDIQMNLTTILGFHKKTLPSKYQGIPLTVRDWKKFNWEKIVSKLEDIVKCWIYITLNIVGRLVLAKAIL